MACVARRQPERCEETCHFLGVGTSAQTRHDPDFTQIPTGRRRATSFLASARRGPERGSLVPLVCSSQSGEVKRRAGAASLIRCSGELQLRGSFVGAGFATRVWERRDRHSRDAPHSRDGGSALITTKYFMESPTGNCFRVL